MYQVLSRGVRVEIRSSVTSEALYGDIQDVRERIVTVRILDRAGQSGVLNRGSTVRVIAKCLKETLQMDCTIMGDTGKIMIVQLPQSVKVIRGMRHYRKRTRFKAKCAVADQPRDAFDGIVTDLSIAGLQLESDRELEVGARLRVEFSLPEGGRPIRAEGEVVRLIPHGPEGFGPRPRVGVKFVELSRLDLPRLRSFVEDRPQTPMDQAA